MKNLERVFTQNYLESNINSSKWDIDIIGATIEFKNLEDGKVCNLFAGSLTNIDQVGEKSFILVYKCPMKLYKEGTIDGEASSHYTLVRVNFDNSLSTSKDKKNNKIVESSSNKFLSVKEEFRIEFEEGYRIDENTLLFKDLDGGYSTYSIIDNKTMKYESEGNINLFSKNNILVNDNYSNEKEIKSDLGYDSEKETIETELDYYPEKETIETEPNYYVEDNEKFESNAEYYADYDKEFGTEPNYYPEDDEEFESNSRYYVRNEEDLNKSKNSSIVIKVNQDWIDNNLSRLGELKAAEKQKRHEKSMVLQRKNTF